MERGTHPPGMALPPSRLYLLCLRCVVFFFFFFLFFIFLLDRILLLYIMGYARISFPALFFFFFCCFLEVTVEPVPIIS